MTEPIKTIDPNIYKDAADALKIAKITLMMGKNTTFYTTILFSLKQSICDDLPTAATDGRNLLIHPQFFVDLTPNERLTLLAHEVLHVALDHMHRLGKRNPQLWNIAADYVINGSLAKANYILPKGALIDNKYNDMTTEEVYKLLDKKSDKEKSSLVANCQDGVLNGNDINYPKDAKPGDEVTQKEVTEIILRATTQAKAMNQDPGSLPGEIAIELKKVVNPPLPWYVIFQNYLTEFAKDDYSFRRPNKRFMPKHYLPCAFSESIANIAIVLDLSCSVSDHEINTFITKIDEIMNTMQPKKITIVAFDTKIRKVQELTNGDDPFKTLKFQARGGTQISPVHAWAAVNKPTVMMILTDGEFRKTEPIDKTIPIIWLIHDDPKWTTDYGKVIHYDIPNK